MLMIRFLKILLEIYFVYIKIAELKLVRKKIKENKIKTKGTTKDKKEVYSKLANTLDQIQKLIA